MTRLPIPFSYLYSYLLFGQISFFTKISNNNNEEIKGKNSFQGLSARLNVMGFVDGAKTTQTTFKLYGCYRSIDYIKRKIGVLVFVFIEQNRKMPFFLFIFCSLSFPGNENCQQVMCC
jgi:hypothetical protein